MIDVKELQRLSDQREKDRQEYWRQFNQEVRPSFLEMVEKAITNSAAIYWRSATIRTIMSEAEHKYLLEKGFNVSSNPTTSLWDITISW